MSGGCDAGEGGDEATVYVAKSAEGAELRLGCRDLEPLDGVDVPVRHFKQTWADSMAQVVDRLAEEAAFLSASVTSSLPSGHLRSS